MLKLGSGANWRGVLFAWLPGFTVLAYLMLGLARAQDTSGAVTPPGAAVIGVVFDHEPNETGLTFARENVHPATIQLGGKMEDAWLAETSAEAVPPGTRSFLFNVTDPRFQKGARPVVDLEIVYYLPPRAEMQIKVDSSDGASILEKIVGEQPAGWQTRLLHLNNAYFGARNDPHDVAPKLDGADIRIDSNTNFNLRSVRLIGYDPDSNIDWTQMLKVGHLTVPTPGGAYLFAQAPRQEMDVSLQNESHVDRPLYYKIQVSDYQDMAVLQKEGLLKIPARSTFPLEIVFDATPWKLGPYDGTIQFYLDQADPQPFLSRSFRLGIITSTVLDKAWEGEFLYGLDPANGGIFSTHSPIAFEYYRLMGVDIVRNIYDKDFPGESVAMCQAALADYARENVRGLVMSVPPMNPDPHQRQLDLDGKTALLEAIAKACAGPGIGKAQYWELGNEPDLPGFNPNSMSDYASSYYAMYDAVKKGAQEAGTMPGDTQVMEGGLSFAGEVGDARSREFLQILDIHKIDVIAYHGHGPGIDSERHAYLRIREAADKYGKAVKPFAETESGVSVGDRPGLMQQARTAVEKMTYAQSVGEPFLMFFRLFMEGSGMEGGYGLTDNFVEPHPSVMSYRNMVERLRHFHYVKALDFSDEPGAKTIDSYVFEERDSQQKPTGRKTVVAFCEDPAHFDLRLQMDQSDVKILSPTLYDMFGNPTPMVSAGGAASATVGQDPVYLSWSSPGSADAVTVAPSILAVNANAPILVGATTSIPITLRNPGTQTITAELTAAVRAQVSGEVSPGGQTFSLAPEESVATTVKIHLNPTDQPLELPFWWKVFLDVDYTRLTPDQLGALPDTLPGIDGATTGKYVWAENNHIDLGKLAGSYHEKRSALVYAVLDSPQAVSLSCGANGDWWMAWYLNGQKIYDTLQNGNLERNLAAHSFNLPLKPGRNVLCVAILSGSQGWSLDFGGPKELQIAGANGEDPDILEVSLKASDQVLAHQNIPLKLQAPVPKLGVMTSSENPEEWMPLEPLAILDSEAVKNYWVKEPDSSKWYKGKQDLSGIVWLRDDGQNLQLFAAVSDDKLVQAATSADLPKNDSIHLVLVDDAGKSVLDTTAGLVNNSPIMTGTTTGLTFKASRQEGADAVTYYHLTIPKSLVGLQPFHFNLAVSDNDSTFLKQIIELGNMDTPTQGKRLVMGP